MKVEMKSIIISAAKAAHEANRAYCEACGDMSQTTWDDAPSWQKDSAKYGVEQIISDPSTTPEQSHEGWLKVKLEDGWKYGPVKDADKKEHPCMVLYDQLPAQQRAKDLLFGTVVRGVLLNYGVIAEELM
jgi:hypothetical protein